MGAVTGNAVVRLGLGSNGRMSNQTGEDCLGSRRSEELGVRSYGEIRAAGTLRGDAVDPRRRRVIGLRLMYHRAVMLTAFSAAGRNI